jgi:muconolactone delta-isomerase
MEYLVTMTTHVPERTPETAVDDIRAREAAHTRELAAQRHVLRLWRPPLQPGEWRTLGLFAAADDGQREFLVTFTVTVPAGTPGPAVQDAEAQEAERARELAGQGHLARLWALPGEGRSLGLWRAQDEAAMAAILASLPLDGWMTEQITPLSPHPSDPGLAGR